MADMEEVASWLAVFNSLTRFEIRAHSTSLQLAT